MRSDAEEEALQEPRREQRADGTDDPLGGPVADAPDALVVRLG